MKIALIDLDVQRSQLFPLTLTRPVADLRIGIFTIREKWEKRLKQEVSFLPHSSLYEKFPPLSESFDLVINGAICPDETLIKSLLELNEDTALYKENIFIGAKIDFNHTQNIEESIHQKNQYSEDFVHIDRCWDIFLQNADEIKKDFDLLTKDRKSSPINDPHTIQYGKENIFVEGGVNIKAAILNAEEGPIYIGKNATISEGSMIKGPSSFGEGATVNMGAKIRGGTTIGPGCKVGGEVSNSILHSNSNKGHDGFLGNAVLGEWCNLGADTNNSNLKNNYADIKMWDEITRDFIDTGLQFCGLIMGDHSKTAINTMFNTGTTVGVCANVYGAGFPRTYIPSFSWGGVRSLIKYDFEKAMETVGIVMKRRGESMKDFDLKLLQSIFENSNVKTS